MGCCRWVDLPRARAGVPARRRYAAVHLRRTVPALGGDRCYVGRPRVRDGAPPPVEKKDLTVSPDYFQMSQDGRVVRRTPGKRVPFRDRGFKSLSWRSLSTQTTNETQSDERVPRQRKPPADSTQWVDEASGPIVGYAPLPTLFDASRLTSRYQALSGGAVICLFVDRRFISVGIVDTGDDARHENGPRTERA